MSDCSSAAEVPPVLEVLEHLSCHALWRPAVPVAVHSTQADFRAFWWLIRVVDASETLDLSGARLLVKALGVPLLAHVDWNIHENLNEIPFSHQGAGLVPVCPVGRNEADKGDGPTLREELRQLCNTADVLLPVLGTEPQVLVESMTDVVPIQVDGELAMGVQSVLQSASDCTLPTAAKASEPQHATPLVEQLLLVLPGDPRLVPLDVSGLPNVVSARRFDRRFHSARSRLLPPGKDILVRRQRHSSNSGRQIEEIELDRSVGQTHNRYAHAQLGTTSYRE
mmetsp:Transcript_6425/g.17965  ORF Transcript_6425/g.17965 Transcript_6425/m.17965 type:complete len:281 (+) Transcript_6425:1084-1926(+)